MHQNTTHQNKESFSTGRPPTLRFGHCIPTHCDLEDNLMTPFRSLFLVLCATLFGLSMASKGVADDESSLAGLKWRNIGPAFMSGRIADIAWHPQT